SDSLALTIVQRSPAPVSSSMSHCGDGIVVLNSAGADSVQWYDDQQNFLFDGSDFSTPSLNQTTVYFLRAGSVCPGAWVSDTVFIQPKPADPLAYDVSRCG